MNGIFITGSDTEVGKTWVSCAIIRTLRQSVKRIGAYKPVASGVANLFDSDASQLWEIIGRIQSIDMVCPQSFAAPLAPPLAASMENLLVDHGLLISGAEAWKEHCDFLVVEGAGGLLSPLTYDSTNADLAERLGWPIVIVVADRLGAVNQSLMAFEVAHARKLKVNAIVLNETTKPSTKGSYDDHMMLIAKQIQASNRIAPRIVRMPYGETAIHLDCNLLFTCPIALETHQTDSCYHADLPMPLDDTGH